MYVAHILRIELHERVVYQLRRGRLLISLFSRNFGKQFSFIRERKIAIGSFLIMRQLLLNMNF